MASAARLDANNRWHRATVMVMMLLMTMLLFYITVKVSKVHDPSRSAVHTPLPRDGAGGRRKVIVVGD